MTSLSETLPLHLPHPRPHPATAVVVAGRAWQAYLDCDERESRREAQSLPQCVYLRRRLPPSFDATGSTAGFGGRVRCRLWWDIDRVGNIEPHRHRWLRRDGTTLQACHLHVGRQGLPRRLPAALWQPAVVAAFNRIARTFAERVADAKVTIDAGVYDKVRAFHEPNSRHPRTGLHKRQVTLDALMHLAPTILAAAVRDRAVGGRSWRHKQDAADLWRR